MRSLLAYWIGGAESPPVVQAGYKSLLTYWIGGSAIGGAVVEDQRKAGSMLASQIIRRRMRGRR